MVCKLPKIVPIMNERQKMVDEIRKIYGLDSSRVLSAMLQVPRDKFIDPQYKELAYRDGPVPIGFGQTMSQPYTVAFMTDLLTDNKKIKEWKVMEIGTGSGYQAAILSKLVEKVFTIEIVPELAERAKKTLKKLGYKNIYVELGSGEWGWKEHAPYNAIMITAQVEKVPQELFNQLKTGGVLVAPVGGRHLQTMTRYTKRRSGSLRKESFQHYVFVPFIKKDKD